MTITYAPHGILAYDATGQLHVYCPITYAPHGILAYDATGQLHVYCPMLVPTPVPQDWADLRAEVEAELRMGRGRG